MHPIIINSRTIQDIAHATHSVRVSCPHTFLPSLRLRVFMRSGPQPKDYNNIKTYMFHKKGMFVIGINKWNGMPKELKHMRYIMKDIPFVALINNTSFKGENLDKCKMDLLKNNIDSRVIDAWTHSSETLNNYSPKPICFGLQSSGYILMLQGPFQTYNKVPGYVYPAEYMKPRPYVTKLSSY
tara:strand:- start:6695 stop:7243 length:549 start_codon:yes stop_codon:yes gene_type:complete